MSAKAKPVVVKIGGSTLGKSDTSLRDLVSLQQRGALPVMVHGGGPTITEWMERQGILPRFIEGLRVTDGPSLEIVIAVLAGLINKQLVAAIIAMGGKAIGLSGVDGAILQAKIGDSGLGFVGNILHVNSKPILELVNAGYIPVVAPVSLELCNNSQNPWSILNINGDTAAGYLAEAISAEKLIFLTDVKGVMNSSKDLIPQLTTVEARNLINSGVAKGGMIPKLEACIKALERVSMACIADGRAEGALIRAFEGRLGGTWVNS